MNSTPISGSYAKNSLKNVGTDASRDSHITSLDSTFELHDQTQNEMPRSHKGLVDTCFEEGHYESGIQALDKLRSVRYRPTISHVRQLIYMSLYPPAPPISPMRDGITSSPRKLHALRQRRNLMPSNRAIQLATRLLCALARTTMSQSLFRAIPAYVPPNPIATRGVKGVAFKNISDVDEMIDKEMEDSAVGREAKALGLVRDCWALLEPGLVRRLDGEDTYESDSEGENDEYVKPVVGQHSWGLLEFFVDVFEEDEKRAALKDSISMSPVLISQIPRAQPGQPWDVQRPLSVVFAALSPCRKQRSGSKYVMTTLDPLHAQLGIRLFQVITNATMADTKLVPTGLIRLTINQLRGPKFPPENMQFFLSSLPPRYDRFKLALVCTFLEGGTVIPKVAVSNQAKRAKPRPRTGPEKDTPSESPGVSSSTSIPVSLSSYPIPSITKILRHLSSASFIPPSATANASSSTAHTDMEYDAKKSALAKLHLLIILDRILASSASGNEDTRDEWRAALCSGKVRKAIQEGFDSFVGSKYDKDLEGPVKAVCFAVVDDLEKAVPSEDATMDPR